MAKVKKGIPLKSKYDTKIPPMGRREVENSKEALRLLRSLAYGSARKSNT